MNVTGFAHGRLDLEQPLLTANQMDALKTMDYGSWRSKTIDATFPVEEGVAGLSRGLARLASESEKACDDGYQFIVLSDRATSSLRVPISPLLATGRVHHHLVEVKKRCKIGALFIELCRKSNAIRCHTLRLRVGSLQDC